MKKEANKPTILPTVLIVDDEPAIVESYKLFLKDYYNILTAYNGNDAIKIVKSESVNAVLLDILMPGIDGIKTLEKIKQLNDNVEVIMVTSVKNINTALQSIKFGAFQYITKPVSIDDVLNNIGRIIEKQELTKKVRYLNAVVDKQLVINTLEGKSQVIQQISSTIGQVAGSTANILIAGEPGTEKEVAAKMIHDKSINNNIPFIKADCSAIPELLLENELFGYEKNTFKNDPAQKIGLIELANNGILYIHDIEKIGLEIQAKIQQAIQNQYLKRIGGIKKIGINTRIISSTGIDLKKAVKQGKFREDLYYKLNILSIIIPPLRERKEDIPLLINYFIKQYNSEFSKQVEGMSDQAMKFMANYYWPGNIHELRNAMERLVYINNDKLIPHKKLPTEILMYKDNESITNENFKEACKSFEKEFIILTLHKNKWNQTKSAIELGIHRNTLLLKIKELGITQP